MITVHKTVLKWADQQIVSLPKGAEILHAAVQRQTICIWYKCDDTAPMVECTITIVGTGYPAPEIGKHLGSAISDGGTFVWHVFIERLP